VNHNQFLNRMTFTVLCAISQSAFSQNSAFVVGADDWCPFTCESKEKPGIVVEIGEKILKEKGFPIVYKVLAWPKAVRDSQRGTISALAGASRPDGVHLVFPLEEQGLQKSCVYFSKNFQNISSITSLSSLKNKKLGITSGYSYGEPLDSLLGSQAKKTESGIQFLETSAATPTEELLAWLSSGKIDAFVESDAVLNYFAQKNSWKNLPVSAFCITPISVYFAFSDKHPKAREMALWLTEGMQKMRKNGELKKILDNYGLKDWK
jgi:polar amino acid transport system substrate-binding protein